MGTFSKQARIASQKVRSRNAALRRKGLLPPIKRKSVVAKKESLPLNHPIFDQPPGGGKTVKKAPAPNNREVLLRLLSVVEKLL